MRKYLILAGLTFFAAHIMGQNLNSLRVEPTSNLGKLAKELDDFLIKNQIPALSVAVSIGNETLWLDARGFSDVASTTLAKPQSIFPIGSIAKSFTATGVMILINQGKLKLTDKLADILPQYNFLDIDSNRPDVQIWQVLSMTAGFNHGWMSYADESFLPYKDTSYSEVYWKENVIIAYPPGTVYEYSNFSMGVAQLICEKISGLPFEKFMKEYLFDPLSMKNTRTIYDPKTKGLVTTYNTKGLPINPGFGTPAGGLGFWSSAEDLLIYGKFHIGVIKNENIISENLLKVQHNFSSGIGDLFGLGWFKSENALISNGNVTGGNAAIKLFPKEKIVIVSMINKTSWNSLADEWLGKIENHLFDTSTEPYDGYKIWKRIYGTDYVPNYKVLGKWSGHLKTPNGKKMNVDIIFSQDSSIHVGIDDQKYPVNNATLNLLGDISGSIDGTINIVSNQIESYDIQLHLYGNSLSGYFAYRGSTEKYGYRKPLYAFFEKE